METPPAEELMKKIRQLEEGQAVLKREMSKLVTAGDRRRSHSVSPQRSARLPPSGSSRRSGGEPLSPAGWRRGSISFGHSSRLQRESRDVGGCGSADEDAVVGCSLSEKQCLNALQSMGQSVHIFDLNGRIIYWNRSAENLYGYSATEALGQDAFELILDAREFDFASRITDRINMGESWREKIPVKHKSGEHFLAISTNTPFYDDNGSLVGIVCVSNDSRFFHDMDTSPSSPKTYATGFGQFNRQRTSFTIRSSSESQQPLQAAIASKISNLAISVTNKVRSKMKTSESSTDRDSDGQHSEHGFSDAEHKEDANSSGASTPRDVPPSPFDAHASSVPEENSPGKQSRVIDDLLEGKAVLQKIISSKAEAWISKKGISWPWKGQERESLEAKNRTTSSWPWLHNDQDNDSDHHKTPESSSKPESQAHEGNRTGNNDTSGSWSSANANSTSSISSTGSNSSTPVHKLEMDSDCLDYEILWEDLTIGEQIGQGSSGTVYHALWYGSDVAVKVFTKLEYSEEIILSFRQEVSLMKRLRHPNILLFMGAVTSAHRLCIVTEFLPRGSLFRLLQRSNTRLDWRRRVQMAMDIARGMNYLHHCNPPIIHRDLKSSNLLVDKNWTVKVADFGLSRLKHATYLSTKTGKGTPQWMAPEVLRNEASDEKSDVYSYGVILWELVTEKIPWENLNSMQIIGAIGFMNQRLDLPEDLDPRWVSIIESCWHSEPSCRPSFQEILEKLKDIQRQTVLQNQLQRSMQGEHARSSTKLNDQDDS